VKISHRQSPRLRTGAIVSAAVCDVARLEVDVLSVRTGLITERLLATAHAAGREVHAWTIADPDVMGHLIDRGSMGSSRTTQRQRSPFAADRDGLPLWQRFVSSLQGRLSRR
jgi:hypothetical protein